MTTLMKLMVALGIDTTEYEKGLKDAEGKAASTGQKIGSGLSAAGAGMMKLGAGMTAAVTTPIIAMSAVAVNAASDLSETVSKVGVVFGQSAASVLAFGETSATALGMSKNEALSAAGTYGNLFRAMGITEQASAKMSVGLVTLAGDLASFNNMDPTEVLDKLRAGLSGETEPLRTLGVNINAAMVEAKAMEMGLADLTGELTPAAKAQATYALILEQTSLAQGDFARTSAGLANQQRILKARFANVTAELGARLLPIALKLVEWLNQLIGMFGNLSPKTQNLVLIFGGLAAAIGPVIMVLGALLSAIGAIVTFITGPAIAAIGSIIAAAAPIIAVIAAIAAVVAFLYFAWQNNWGGIRDTMTEVWAQLQPILQRAWDWLATNIPIALQTLATFWTTVLLPAIQVVWNWMLTILFPFLARVIALIAVTFVQAITALANFWRNTLWPALQAVWGWMSEVLFPFLEAFVNFISAVFDVAIQTLANTWQNVLWPAIQSVWAFLSDNLWPLFKAFGEWLDKSLGPMIQRAADVIRDLLGGAFEWASGELQKLTAWLNRLASAIRGLTRGRGGGSTPQGASVQGAAVTATPSVGAVSSVSAGAGSVTYNIFTKDNPGRVTDALTLSQMLGGAA